MKKARSRLRYSRTNSHSNLSKSFALASFNQSLHTSVLLHTEPDSPSPERLVKRPVSLSILEKYFSDICQDLTENSEVSSSLLSKIENMEQVLKDCLFNVQDLSLEIFYLISSSLKDLKQVQLATDEEQTNTLMKKLVKIGILIEEDRFRSSDNPAVRLINTQSVSETDLSAELDKRVARVTARVLTMWKKILTPQREAGIISCCFLLLYCEVDKSIQLSPYFKVKYEKAVNYMKEYCGNPGHVVTVVRKTREYIETGKISMEVMKRLSESLVKIDKESVNAVDKTFTAFILYDLVLHAFKYFEWYSKKNENLNFSSEIRQKNNIESPSRSPIKERLSLKNINLSKETKSQKVYDARFLAKVKARKMKTNFISKTVKKEKDSARFSKTETSSPSRVLRSLFTRTETDVGLTEEGQYQQFLERNFRTFISQKMIKNGNKDRVQENKEVWMREFEDEIKLVRTSVIQKLFDDRRFASEIMNAKSQVSLSKDLA